METISFEQALFQQQNENEIKKETERFRRIFGKVMADTLFQLTNFDLIEKGIDISDYVINKDINSTTFDKMKKWSDNVECVINGEEFNKNQKSIKIVSAIVSRKYKNKKIDLEE